VVGAPGADGGVCCDAGTPGAGGVVVAGCDAGPGAGNACLVTGGAGVPLTTEPVPRCPMIDSASASSMNNAAQMVVAFVSSVAPERAPNAA